MKIVYHLEVLKGYIKYKKFLLLCFIHGFKLSNSILSCIVQLYTSITIFISFDDIYFILIYLYFLSYMIHLIITIF